MGNLDGPARNRDCFRAGVFQGRAVVQPKSWSNEIVLKLERDPFGLLPSDACGAGESLLYVDDFQDGEAQGWKFDQTNTAAQYVGWRQMRML